MQAIKTKSKFNINRFNFAIPLMAFAGIATLGIGFINYNPEDFASATNKTSITGTISYEDEYITITNNAKVDLGTMAVTKDSSYAYATDNVTVSTNVPTGYDLYISAADNSSAALKNPDSYTEITATSGTGGSGGTPKVLDADSYGYGVDKDIIGNSGFSTSSEYINPISTTTWAGVPAGTSDRLRSTNTATGDSGETTSVYYGVNVTNYLAPGQYTGDVIYSAVATPSSNDVEMTVSPNNGIYKDVLTITSGPKDFISASHRIRGSEVEVIFSQEGSTKGSCNILNVENSAGYLVTSCVTPDLATGIYDIEIIIPRYGFRDKIIDGYTSNEYVNATPLNITMQNFTTSTCESLNSFDNTRTRDTTYYITDSRDDNRYRVRKFIDGHCWMVQNLRILDKNISTSNSDISGNFTIPSSTSTYSKSSSTSGTWCATESSSCINKPLAYYNNNTTYGAYYNWYAATAGSGTYASSSSSNVINYSICPKGWKLPLGTTSVDSEYSWYYLYNNTFGADVSNFQTSTNTGPGYWAGYYTSSLSNLSGGGFWWSRTAYNASTAYGMSTSSDTVNPTSNSVKYVGRSVRCVFAGS